MNRNEEEDCPNAGRLSKCRKTVQMQEDCTNAGRQSKCRKTVQMQEYSTVTVQMQSGKCARACQVSKPEGLHTTGESF